MSLTSLIDVIFLLLLFFMLSSTFSRFSEVELAAGGAGTSQPDEVPPLFLRLGASDVSLNGEELVFERIAGAVADRAPAEGALPVIVSLRREVSAQRLTDLLVALRAVPRLAVTVLGAG